MGKKESGARKRPAGGAPAVSDTNVCEGKEVTTFLTEAMRATPSQIGYVRKGAARGLLKVGVRILPSLARKPA